MRWRKLPLPAERWLPPASNPLPYAGLLSSLPEEQSYECPVEGNLPNLQGTLYRVGPGLYDRGPDRKRMVLDGDGMVQALTIANGSAHYRTRFVRTQKYQEEEAANRFLYPTFSTHGSGPMRYNLGLSIPNQANTTVLEWAGRVWAFDEGQRPYELSRDLETLGEGTLDEMQPDLKYWAHWKLDATHPGLHLLAISQGRVATANIVTLTPGGQVVSRRAVTLPRSVYIHDWFVTENYFAFLLHPAFINFGKMFSVLIGRETFANAIQWQPEKESVFFVAHRHRDQSWSIPVRACWMWHAINAFDDGDDLVCDFIGAESGGGLGDEPSPQFQIMSGVHPGRSQNGGSWVRRYRVRPSDGQIKDQIIANQANFELPCVSAMERAKPYSKAYMIQADPRELFARNLCQLDGETLETVTYSFAPGEFCSEPVFCDVVGEGRGRYLITQVYSAAEKTSHFAVFDEASFSAGPVARIPLTHHVPVSFHGYWSSA